MSCVLWVRGDFDPEEFLSTCSWEADAVWMRGESLSRNEIAKDSGFSVIVSEAPFDALEDQLHDATRFLHMHEGEFARLGAVPGVTKMVLSFGVAQRIQPAWSIDLGREFVAVAGERGLDLRFALYAVSKMGGFS